jgi:hypothetical protein
MDAETQRSAAAHIQQWASQLEKLALQISAHRRKFELSASQFSQFAEHYASVATDAALGAGELGAYTAIGEVFNDFAELFRQYVAQHWAHAVLANGASPVAGEVCAFITRLCELAQVLDAAGADALDPSSPKWLQFHVLDLTTIGASLRHHLEVNPGTPSARNIAERLSSIQRFLDEGRGEDPVPGGRYFSPIPVVYQSWRMDHADYTCEKEVGTGVSAVVYYGHDTRSGAELAVKQFKWTKLQGPRLKVFEREIMILASANHPALLRFVGAVDSPPFAIITEWMSGGTLYHELHHRHKLADTQLTIAAIDIARGMEYLHSKAIVHRDLKSLNVLLTADGEARICDFGFSRSLSQATERRMTTNIGTPHWMAPEILTGNGIYDEKVDVYAYAVVLWEILVKVMPYKKMKPMDIVQQVVANDIRPPIPTTCPKRLRGLIEVCWARDPVSRPSFRQILAEMMTDPVLYPEADKEAVEAYLWAKLGDAGSDTGADLTLEAIAAIFAKEEVPVENVDRAWNKLTGTDRSTNPELFWRCVCHFVRTQRSAEAMALLKNEPAGSIPRESAAMLASMLPTGKDALNFDIVIIACKHGAAAEAAVHSMHPNHVKLALEVVARAGVSEENVTGIVQRCTYSVRGNDPMLIVAAIRCMVAIGQAAALPLDRMIVCMESRNLTVRLAAYVAVAHIAEAGVTLPSPFLNSCTEKVLQNQLAVTILVAACGRADAARTVVNNLIGNWHPAADVAVRILLKASAHEDLRGLIKKIASSITVDESDTDVANALAALSARL